MAIETTNLVSTSEGMISVWDSSSEGIPVICLHANSTEKAVFHRQFKDLGSKFRLIALDLPGHGKSDNAKNHSTYSMPGYAKVAFEVMDIMKLSQAIILGWSLGGHIGIEMCRQQPSRITGLCIIGTPPIPFTQEGFAKGFKPIPIILKLLGQESFTDAEAREFNEGGGINLEEEPYLHSATMRTHGLARSCMFASMMRGEGGDQKQVVEQLNIPLAVIAGENDVGINNEYLINEVKYNNLWSGRVQVIQGAGHAALLEKPGEFNRILSQFLDDISS